MTSNTVASNRNARRNYEIAETIEAGIVLHGFEVKSLRQGSAKIDQAFARFDNSELWLVGMRISPYSHVSSHQDIDPTRKRKLLLKGTELGKLSAKVAQQGVSIVAMSVYFTRGIAKVKLGVGKPKKAHDKRRDIAERDANRQAQRDLADRNRQ